MSIHLRPGPPVGRTAEAVEEVLLPDWKVLVDSFSV